MNLQTLIETRRQGQSYRQLARNGGLNPNGINTLVNKPLTAYPTPATIRGLSQAINTPIKTIIEAISETLGLTDTDTEEQSQAEYWQHHAQYWKSTANHWKAEAQRLQHHFNQLQPISRERPWLNVGTKAQAHHMNAQDGEQPNPLRGSNEKGHQ